MSTAVKAPEGVEIDVEAAAQILGCRPSTVRYWARTGRIPAGRSRGPRTTRWLLHEIQAVAEKLGIAA